MPANHEIEMARCRVCSQRYCMTCAVACPVCGADHPEVKVPTEEEEGDQKVMVWESLVRVVSDACGF